jgi:hypothetical protein
MRTGFNEVAIVWAFIEFSSIKAQTIVGVIPYFPVAARLRSFSVK